MNNPTEQFVLALPVVDFAAAFDDSGYIALPGDWFVAVTDVVKSREAIAAGRYKAVNMAGAAMIGAVMNAIGTRNIPFIFGGDGAAVAISPADRATAADALARVANFAAEELDLEMRAALVPVEKSRADGFDVRVKAVRLSDAINNYAFTGGGVSHAERLMKAGEFLVARAPAGARPDLTGLSCRWTPVRSDGRKIVSLIAEPAKNTNAADFAGIVEQLIAACENEQGGGNPMPRDGPGVRWPAAGVDMEARATRGNRSLFAMRLRLAAETLLGFFLFRTGIRLGNFDPKHYARMTSLNTDFRKVQDGLRMTVSLTPAQLQNAEKLLDGWRDAGKLRAGLSVQDSAVLTCFVPSITEDNHFHFLDGAGGGYAEAATALH